MADTLSKDLPTEMDIFWEDTEEETTLDIIPDTEEETIDETEEKVEEKVEDKVEEEKSEEDLDTALNDILGDNEKIKEDIDKATDETTEIKDKIEDVKEALQDDDTDSAEKLIDDLYKQVIDYSTKVDTLSTKNDILQSKLLELTTSNTDYELQIAQNVSKSNDPKMLILNRMYDSAVSWEEFSKNKVISTLEDMYFNLTGKSFDDTKIEKISDTNATDMVLNENTPPAIEEEIPEEIDMNDITSIF